MYFTYLRKCISIDLFKYSRKLNILIFNQGVFYNINMRLGYKVSEHDGRLRFKGLAGLVRLFPHCLLGKDPRFRQTDHRIYECTFNKMNNNLFSPSRKQASCVQ